MKLILLVILFFHGIIHVFGFAKAFSPANLNLKVSKTYGILWLATTLLFIAAAATYLIDIHHWWVMPALTVMLSQYLIITNWQDARFGTIANVIIIIAAVNCFANCTQKDQHHHEVIADLSKSTSNHHTVPARSSNGSLCISHETIFR